MKEHFSEYSWTDCFTRGVCVCVCVGGGGGGGSVNLRNKKKIFLKVWQLVWFSFLIVHIYIHTHTNFWLRKTLSKKQVKRAPADCSRHWSSEDNTDVSIQCTPSAHLTIGHGLALSSPLYSCPSLHFFVFLYSSFSCGVIHFGWLGSYVKAPTD